MSYPRKTNPFADDDDFSFQRSSAGYQRGYGSTHGGRDSDGRFESDDDHRLSRREQLVKEIDASKDRQLASQQRMLGSLYESERMGVSTAEELVRQKEQLDNVETKTAAINASMNVSQKHINSIKSVFGGIKNWFSGNKQQPEPEVPPPRQSKLQDIVENESNARVAAPHPVMRMREEDEYRSSDNYRDELDYGYKQNTANYEEQFDKNLGLMSENLSRLKNLGLGLNTEIDAQNQQIDRINEEVGRADGRVYGQTKQINKILHK